MREGKAPLLSSMEDEGDEGGPPERRRWTELAKEVKWPKSVCEGVLSVERRIGWGDVFESDELRRVIVEGYSSIE